MKQIKLNIVKELLYRIEGFRRYNFRDLLKVAAYLISLISSRRLFQSCAAWNPKDLLPHPFNEIHYKNCARTKREVTMPCLYVTFPACVVHVLSCPLYVGLYRWTLNLEPNSAEPLQKSFLHPCISGCYGITTIMQMSACMHGKKMYYFHRAIRNGYIFLGIIYFRYAGKEEN